MISSTEQHNRLSGASLWMARLGWVVVFLLVLALLFELIPANRRLTYGEWYINQTRPLLSSPDAFLTFVDYLVVLETAAAALTIFMGLVVFRYRSDESMGLLASATLIMLSLMAISGNIDTWRFPVGLSVLQPLISQMKAIVLGSYVLFFHLFPDGRFVPRWSRWTAGIALGVVTLFALAAAIMPVGGVSDESGERAWLLFTSPFMGSLVIAVGGQVHRYRRVAGCEQRQQMKWVTFGLATWLGNLLWKLVMNGVLPSGWAAFIGAQLDLFVLALLPITIGFSILRYRLWDVDVVINRTLVYGGITVLLGLVYSGCVVLLQAVFTTISSQQSAVAIAFSTLIIAALFNPVRYWLQAIIDRRFYRRKYDARRTLANFSQAARDEMSLEALAVALERLVQETMQPNGVSVWLRPVEKRDISRLRRDKLSQR